MSGGARDGYRAFRTIPTRWADNDAYGHVNNVVYYSWFDTAVNALLVERGLLDIRAGATIGLVVETGCRYHRSIAFPEDVEAGVRIARMGTSSVRWEVGLFTAGHAAPAAEGFFIHVYVDRASRRPAPLPPDWRAALAGLAALPSDAGG
ncbi:acyl-CoA thioesterase [Polymorphobacter fuscus]|uniref:Acyl-CoA thioesterase n=1 Tax=Sandarakinorhabdus fusca TaxID=1439888 RepID=A0A7C9GQB6_9SPHN|nr:thioesterase family protein [Polymorphobacter fuscus]KAB7644374.1 acyl-CoA thioesterase [Polymorphobacter fuscus]MQT18292.1 acyl-CoA thioesterase [Polymorphobacter fuscus]NJC08186.1 acyl-CoA thioester hydrolase [Polymorphobacter fuscus]